MKTSKMKWVVLFVLSIILVFVAACSMKTNRIGEKLAKEEPSATVGKMAADGATDATKDEASSAASDATADEISSVTSDNVAGAAAETSVEDPAQTSEVKEDPKDKAITITFAVPEIEAIHADRVKKCNEALLEDGHPYQLEIKELEYESYPALLRKELENGNVDVAFLGLGDEYNSVYNVISSGMILNLDDILSSDAGKTLYEAFPAPLWEAVKCNGHHYSIPNCTADDRDIFAVFNKDYFSDAEIEAWDGSLEGIYEMIRKVDWDDKAAPRFQYHLSDFDFASMLRCEIRNGLLYDYDTMQIVNPLESEKFIGYLRTFEQMRRDGYMAKSVSLYYNVSYVSEAENMEAGKYLVALYMGEPEKMYLKDNLAIKQLPAYIPSRINGSIGIAKDTENLDAVVDFLGLLYGGEKYANILLYGKENVDYTIVDGFAVNKDSEDPNFRTAYLTGMILDLFINVHPVKEDTWVENRRESYFSFYETVSVSPFIGFDADSASYSVIPVDLEDFLDSLGHQSLKEALSEYKAKLKADGMDAYVDSVSAQWEAYNK